MYSLSEDGTKIVYRDRIEDVTISLDKAQCLGMRGFEEPPAISWPEDFEDAFAKPCGTQLLRECAKGARRVAVMVSDSTRGVPTAKVLPMVIDIPRAVLEGKGFPESRPKPDSKRWWKMG